MRKEITGICLFFLVILTLVSLVSYHSGDPSILNAKADGPIHNLFGVFGAHLSGSLIGLFGLGAFWTPVLLLLASIQILGGDNGKTLYWVPLGGMLLIIATGSLFALQKHHYLILGSQFSAGGLTGSYLKTFLVSYSNRTGAVIILSCLWIVGFISATGFSIMAFARRLRVLFSILTDRGTTLYLKWKERKQKSKRRMQRQQSTGESERAAVEIKKPAASPVKSAPVAKQAVFEFMQPKGGFQLPPVSLLQDPPTGRSSADSDSLNMQSKLLEKKLQDFGVNGRVLTVLPGPVITTFEYEPAPGVKINKVVGLADDLALALRAASLRIVAPIPGKAAIGIEVPNAVRETVGFKEMVVSGAFEKSKSQMTICLGKDIVGQPVVAELDRMPHLLIAGATGSGKSVALNTMICSLLYKTTPEWVKLIMIDPKRIELSIYDGIPHLITPVVKDAQKATNALFWAVKEMERRYELLAEWGARNIGQYNRKMTQDAVRAKEKEAVALPFIVIIIDELADLMMVASREVEVALTRLAQMARAAGIHLIIATQRPSVDVLTGLIKANFPTRLSFQVSSKTDSRTIIDTNGAEALLGNGDMLFLPPGAGRLQRIHGAYISESELTAVTDCLKAQKEPEYDASVTETVELETESGDTDEYDEKYDDAVALITKTRQASISMIQRHLRIGYNRAARIIETMEKEGIVGPADGSKPREVLVRGYDNIP